MIPRYQVGDALFFRYVPLDYINPQTGEVVRQTPDIPCTVLSIAHNFEHEVEITPGVYLPRRMPAAASTELGFYYYVQIDQAEAALMGLTLTYPDGGPLTTEVIQENQITGERIAF